MIIFMKCTYKARIKDSNLIVIIIDYIVLRRSYELRLPDVLQLMNSFNHHQPTIIINRDKSRVTKKDQKVPERYR